MKYNIKQLVEDYRQELYWYLNRIISILSILLFSACIIHAQPIGTKNLGFESGNFEGWKGFTWIYRTDEPSASTSKVEGIVTGRHTIMSDQSAFDENTGGKLKIVPTGYTYSAKLGSEQKGGRHQSLSYTMTIDSTNALIVWKFAVLLQDPENNHEVYEEPRFKITLYDEKGDTIPDCSNYDVYATDARIGGFQTYTPSGLNSPIVWRDWTTVGANLLPYSGKTITIEFMSADCTHKGHFGYGYFVVDCMPLLITVDYCTDDTDATLSAPSGFNSYLWKNESGGLVGSAQNLVILDPQEGDTYICDMESETGCSITLSSQIARYEQEALFSSEMLDCQSNIVIFDNLSTHSRGTLTYLWDFGDGNSSDEEDPVYQFQTSGLHEVGLIIYNPPSGCTDTILQTIESFSPPLVGYSGDTTYCPDMETELGTYGAYSYEWSTGVTSGIVSFGAPGGDYWLLGYSTPEEGCVSDTIRFSISEEPDWPLAFAGDGIICDGDTDTIYVVGAVEYSWNTGDTTDFIAVSTGGTYSVEGTNVRGCVKVLDIDVMEVKKPDLDFSVSPRKINRRNNTVTCSARSTDDVKYEWNMGDGNTSISKQLTYNYSINTELISYPVTITATNDANCFTSKSTMIYIEPFVPNVFTPNNDGVNDLFMVGYNLKIFDRHGIVLFTGNSGWDGYYNGQLVDPDTYFYQLNYINDYGQEQSKKGFTTLVR